jgi:DNA-binding response OmpR family regulator
MSSARLLVISKNPELAEERRTLLQRTGYEVVGANNFRQVQEICERGDFHIAIIGYSIPPKEKRRIWAELITRCPHAPILELFDGTAPHLADAQYYLSSHMGIDWIPRKVQEILKPNNGNS